MKKIYEHPLIRIGGVLIILYFGLLYNKTSEKSLSNRLSKEKMEQNFNRAKQESNNFMTNLKKIKEIKDEIVKKEQNKQILPSQPQISSSSEMVGNDLGRNVSINNFIIVDSKKGSGSQVHCSDKVTISYKIYSYTGKTLKQVKGHSFVVGSNQSDSVIEKNILGMKESGVRLLLKGKQPTNSNQKEEIMSYYIELLKVEAGKKSNAQLNCSP